MSCIWVLVQAAVVAVSAQQASYWLLIIPFIAFTVSLLLVPLVHKYVDQIDDWMAKRRDVRLLFAIIFLATVPVGFATFIDIADVSEILQGTLRKSDVWWLTGAAILAAIYIAAQLVSWSHKDRWDKRIEKERQAVEKQRLLAEENRKDRDFFFFVNKAFLGVVGLKWERVRTKLEGLSSPVSIEELQDACRPDDQIVALIRGVFEIFRGELNAVNKHAKLRVALFENRDGQLELAHCWDGNSQVCVQNGDNFKERLNLSKGATDCLAVWVAHKKKLEIVPNAEEADRDERHPFKYFRPLQRNQIRSLTVWPLERSGEVAFVFCVDTDQDGFFNEGRRAALDMVADNLAHRLLFETDMRQLLNGFARND